jgi:VanZ family protein
MQNRFTVALIAALAGSILIGYVDSGPGWDDTGITFGLLFMLALATFFLAASRPLTIGVFAAIAVPAFNIFRSGSFESLAAFIPALAGSFLGHFLCKQNKLNDQERKSD